ncbi:hypothetical protein BO94DRAFT_547541 [Aspergillus sclerotioniger CBS 115572]|uniref:Uncharacterized protein n=1 Tax=Aspergillus sclerotioniger CBS 115572 TaxID=1450535 RepID=A0A317WFU6_9EURO|nr:hypothetical protein BO94DRAFT_547541 [Aspergillus sclerotioniger CBS 115572]PWY83898.1 hypothetical protein BO94DRAFT_547541 [Aspergillus sclerotioniger CBS 115572]
MNKVGFISFSDDQTKKVIGTRNLNSCTAVMLASTKGAILAHISPLPGPTNDPDAGEKHVREKMTEFVDLYLFKKDIRLGPEMKQSGIVCGIYLGQIAVPDQQRLIESILQENLEDKPRPKVIPYQINVGGHNQAAGGTVFIDGRHPLPKVYVEDKDQGWF